MWLFSYCIKLHTVISKCMYTDLVNFSDPEWEDINVVAGALKLFLEKLPDPLIPYSLYNKFIKAGSKNTLRCYLLYSLKFWKTNIFMVC